MLAYSAKSSVTSFYYSFCYPYLKYNNIWDKNYPISLEIGISFKENYQNCHITYSPFKARAKLLCIANSILRNVAYITNYWNILASLYE